MTEMVEMADKQDSKWRGLLLELFESEIKSRNVLKEIEADVSKTDEEKKALKQQLRDGQKKLEEKKTEFLKQIEKINLSKFTRLINILQAIYVEQRDYQTLVKRFLTCTQIRRKIIMLRKADFNEAYDLIEFISNSFPVDEYPMYTLKPTAPLYGAEVEKTAKGGTLLIPLSKDEVVGCLDVFVEKNDKAFYTWIMAMLSFDNSRLNEAFKELMTKDRQELLSEIKEKLKSDSRYQGVMSKWLFERGTLFELAGMQLVDAKEQSQNKALEEKYEVLQKKIIEKEACYKNKVANLHSVIEDKQAVIEEKQFEINSLQAKLKNYDELSYKLTQYIEKYNAQISINERITIENDIRIHEVNETIACVEKENETLKTNVGELNVELENVKSDLSLKLAEIKTLKETIKIAEIKAKEAVLCDVVKALKDQLYYISLFYLELMETGSLGKESVNMFGGTIQNIEAELRSVGIEMYGRIDEEITYDSALYEAVGVKLSNGDKAILRIPGWKIGGAVYVKAQVEKESINYGIYNTNTIC